MLILYAVLPLDPDHREAALEATQEIAERSREEPGVIDYRASTDVERPNTLRFLEQYEDAAALEAHLETDHYAEFEETVIEGMLDGEPTLHRFEADPID
jgi:quinol monooxygenase YgiN